MKNRSFFGCMLCLYSLIANAEITEKDLFMYGDMVKYKREVVVMLNRLSKNHPSCIKHISPETAGISKERSKPNNPSFFVQCGDKQVPEVVRFSLRDIRHNNIPKAAKNISKTKGTNICSKEAKKKALIPLSVNFSTFLNVGYDPKPNGNTVISSTFTASNAYGVKQKFRIFCFFNGKQELADVTVKTYNE